MAFALHLLLWILLFFPSGQTQLVTWTDPPTDGGINPAYQIDDEILNCTAAELPACNPQLKHKWARVIDAADKDSGVVVVGGGVYIVGAWCSDKQWLVVGYENRDLQVMPYYRAPPVQPEFKPAVNSSTWSDWLTMPAGFATKSVCEDYPTTLKNMATEEGSPFGDVKLEAQFKNNKCSIRYVPPDNWKCEGPDADQRVLLTRQNGDKVCWLIEAR